MLVAFAFVMLVLASAGDVMLPQLQAQPDRSPWLSAIAPFVDYHPGGG